MPELVAFCRELQRLSGNDPFFLDYGTAGRLCDIHQSTAGAWLRLMVQDGFLRLVERGDVKAHRANRYKYVGD